jgi:hypothetical protein
MYDPQSWDRYSYVNDNPMRYTDPTGHVRVADEDLQKNKASMSCSKNPQYCKNGKPMTKEELKAVWDERHPRKEKEKIQEDGKESSGGLRWPDYTSLNIATGWPFAVVGFDIQITRDNYNNWYIAPRVYGGTPGASLFGGYILQKEQPNEHDVEDFVSSHSVFLGGGYWAGGGGAWGHPFDGDVDWKDFAAEGGVSSPGGAGGYTYGILLYDHGDSTPWIWQGDR